MLKAFKTLRNHWKKSTAAFAVSCYGIYYFRGKYRQNLLRRYYCEQAQKYGEKLISPHAKLRNVTVILNPAAGGRKAKDVYEKNAEPLLHLAGLDVTVIKTEKEGQATQLMEVMEKTDAVLIAGGDGTLLEAITGLLRRSDKDEATEELPIGVIPVGRHNTFIKHIFPSQIEEEVSLCGEAVMAAIAGQTRPCPVVEIKNEEDQSVYMLCYLQWGPLRDAWARRSKYWYFGPLKKWLTYVFAAPKLSSTDVKAKLSYIAPCKGCATCTSTSTLSSQPSTTQTSSSQTSSNTSWLQRLFGFTTRHTSSSKSVVAADDAGGKLRQARLAEQLERERHAAGEPNPDCGKWVEVDVAACDLLLTTPSTQVTDQMQVHLGPHNLSRSGFILEGWQRQSDSLDFDRDRNSLLAACSELKVEVEEGRVEGEEKAEMYCIDSEEYEARSFTAKLIPNAFLTFTQYNPQE